MAEGRDRAEWSRLSHLLAAIHNSAGRICDESIDASDLNPYEADRAAEALIEVPKVIQHSLWVELTPEQKQNLLKSCQK